MEVSVDLQKEIKGLIGGLSPKEKEILRAYISIPNHPDIQPEILRLHMDYRLRLKRVTDLVDAIRVKMQVSYDVLQQAIQKELGIKPR